MAGPQAELTVEEALDLAPVAHARMIGSQRFVFVYQAVGMVLGMLVGAIIGVAISLALQLLQWPNGCRSKCCCCLAASSAGEWA